MIAANHRHTSRKSTEKIIWGQRVEDNENLQTFIKHSTHQTSSNTLYNSEYRKACIRKELGIIFSC